MPLTYESDNRRPHRAWWLAAAVMLATIVPVQQSSAAEDYTFVQSQRMNSLTIQTGTDTFATQNALGGAIETIALTPIQQSLNQSVTNGSISLLLEMPGMIDLSGTNEPSLQVGVMQGFPMQPPGNPATYNGNADLDWWYQPSPSDVDADGNALHQLSASFTAGAFAAGPGPIVFANPFGPVPLRMSGTRMEATTGAPSAPLDSSNGFPPGYLPEENIPDTLTSFGSMSAGRLAGNVSAASLAATPIPAALAGSGLTNCSQAYTVSNSMLDVLVGGCTITFIGTAITPTQPDTVDPTEGSGTYVFTRNLTTKAVNGCLHDGQPAVLADCLDAAAYSSYFHYTTDRVIVRRECEPGSYSSTGFSPCTLASPGFYVNTSGATTQTACPAGTSSAAGATSCKPVTTTTVQCSQGPAVIGVIKLCTATVSDQGGPAATGAVTWSAPTGAGSFLPASCNLATSAAGDTCSVGFVPASGSVGQKQLTASYGGDVDHAASAGGVNLTVVKRSTSTGVTCKPKTVVHGKTTVCTAKVADTSPGNKSAPKGKVRWSARRRHGTFSSTTCKLVTRNGQRLCRVKFKTSRSIRGRIALKANYLGDANHKPSSRRARITVT